MSLCLTSISAPVAARVPTGFPALDQLLGGGWPTGTLTELLVSGQGSGELGLLSPALARLTNAATDSDHAHRAALDSLRSRPVLAGCSRSTGCSWSACGSLSRRCGRWKKPCARRACAGVIAWLGMAAIAAGEAFPAAAATSPGRQAAGLGCPDSFGPVSSRAVSCPSASAAVFSISGHAASRDLQERLARSGHGHRPTAILKKEWRCYCHGSFHQSACPAQVPESNGRIPG